MATFLELCQALARESGTVDGEQPVAVTGQTGRLAKIVHWTNRAWADIQNARAHWFWMQAEFEEVTTAGIARYTASGWSIARHAEWLKKDFTIYRQSEGVAREVPMAFLEYERWRAQYARGVHDQSSPIYWSISPANEVCLGPTPDDIYVVKGPYRKSPQTLSAADDVPEMPARFHSLIVDRGLILLAEHDEAQLPIATAARRYHDLFRELARDQLPPFATFGASPPLA